MPYSRVKPKPHFRVRDSERRRYQSTHEVSAGQTPSDVSSLLTPDLSRFVTPCPCAAPFLWLSVQ
eukprot:31577-Rhodomonas_salina.1